MRLLLASSTVLPSLLLAGLTFLAPAPASASVIGIDYGTEWFKVSIVKAGIPLDIVLNTESKRKTPAVVLVREGDRRYGSDAVALATRFPQDSYPALKNLLGKLYDDPAAETYRKTYTNTMVRDAKRGTVAFRFNETTIFTVEELVAMQLDYAKKQAEETGQEPVTGAVLTVPPYWGQFERRALLDAAELANLKVLSLINDETAVALNYATARTFTTPQYHIFYDMGAGSTVAALVRFHNPTLTGKASVAKKAVLELDVQAVGYDSSLGGHSVDVKLQQLLAFEFMAAHGDKLKGNVFEDSRAMAKLLKEAVRVKQILSANTETSSSIEGLMEDIDFRTKVSRKMLEELSGDVAARVAGPVHDVIRKANITLDQVDSLILVGGGARIPFVQAALIDLVGEGKIAKNVNADEAAVMGAGFRSAGLSTQFRVREIKIKDLNAHPAVIAYDAEGKENGTPRTIRTNFFTEKSALGSKKLMSFKRKSDFSFSLSYNEADGSKQIVRADVAGLEEAIESKKEVSLEEPKVKALIELTEAGVISIGHASAYFEVEQVDKESAGFKDTVMNFFKGKKGDDKTEDGEPEVEDFKDDLNADNSTNVTKNATVIPTKKIVTETVKLNMTLHWDTVEPYDVAGVITSKARLAALDHADAQRRAREEARNTLESFYYSGKELLYEDDVEHTSTEDERSLFKQTFDEISEWIYDAADAAPIEDLKARLKALKDVHTPLHFKFTEHRARDAAVEGFRKGNEAAREVLKTLRDSVLPPKKKKSNDTEKADKEDGATEEEETKPAIAPRYTPQELDSLDEAIRKAEEWLEEKLGHQSKLLSHDHPVLVTRDIADKASAVEREIKRLLTKPFKKVTPKRKTTSTSTSTSTPTSTATSTSTSTSTATATVTATSTTTGKATVTSTSTASASVDHEEL
ncbi:lumenal Hsp70 protein [Thoreauomyces humboldtii]|nr:lumenal Hsp70 protein [Thoreauomyces humboldtii]